MSNHILLIIAHGSRRATSNDEVRELASRVRSTRPAPFGDVVAGFLELAEPSIPEALAECARKGAKQITVLPYFLAAGTHVAVDLPEAVGTFTQAHPDIDVRLTPHLGASPNLTQTLLDLASPSPA